MTEPSSESLREPIRRRVGRGLSARRTLERIAALRANATALFGESWKGKDDGTVVRKTVGRARQVEDGSVREKDRMDVNALQQLERDPHAFD